MAYKVNKQEIIKANLPESRAHFQKLIGYMMDRDIDSFTQYANSLDNDTRRLAGMCMGKDGNTLVHRICQGVAGDDGHLYLDALLSDGNWDVLDFPNCHGKFPIHVIVEENSYSPLMDYLIEHNVSIDRGTVPQNRTAMMLAAQFVDYDLLTYFAEKGANLTAVDKDGKSYQDVLLSNGAGDEDLQNFAAFTIFIDAVSKGQLAERPAGARSRRAL